MESVRIACAQSSSFKGDIEANIQHHLYFCQKAVSGGCDLIIFPELSLTGYEPELAGKLAIDINNEKLNPLSKFAADNSIIISAGIPVESSERQKPELGQIFFMPAGKRNLYSKHYLHPGEEKYFSECGNDVFPLVKGKKIAPAICADISHEKHAVNSFKKNAEIYAASVLIGEKGYKHDAALLEFYAKKYKLIVLMSNHATVTGGWTPAGKSAVWNSDGVQIASINNSEEGIIIAEINRKNIIADVMML
jgi:predicted amidohydrolase